MFEGEPLKNLSAHITSICSSLLNQIATSGAVLTRSGTAVASDIVSAHHIAELLHKLDGNMFHHHLQLLVGWMTSEENGLIESQFTVDTLSQLSPENEVVKKIIQESILPTQLDTGAFTRYTAFLHGGDYFSTLWCLKILQNAGEDNYADSLKVAFQYAVANSDDSGIPIGQIGYLYLLLNRTQLFRDEDAMAKLREKLLHHVSIAEVTPADLLTLLYLSEDLQCNPEDSEALAASRSVIERVFVPEREAQALPKIFTELQGVAHESVVYHCLARACIDALGLMPDSATREVAYSLNRFLHSQGQRAAYVALARDVQLKEYLQKYGGIHREFEPYNDQLERVWSETPFDRSVFIMMPFRKGVTFRTLTNAIRDACKERGFLAIRVDDGNRQLYDRLWDNLVANMLSCRYAVAIYVSEQIVDRLDGNEPKMFPNPNVALEFGFFKSRGQKILLLKDKDSPLPSDLQGFLWNTFDIDDPHEDVFRAVNGFIDAIEKEAEQENATDEE